MESYIIEVSSRTQPPSPDARLILFSHETTRTSDGQAYLAEIGAYARQHKVYAVSGLVFWEGAFGLCLFSPEGHLLLWQQALHRPFVQCENTILGERIAVVPTPLGNVALLPEDDVCVPEAARTAALKGADVLIAIQSRASASLPGRDMPRLAWSVAQTNNVYLIHLGDSCTVVCPSLLTRRGDGYLVRSTKDDTVRFGFNLRRLREVREALPLLTEMNRESIRSCVGEDGCFPLCT